MLYSAKRLILSDTFPEMTSTSVCLPVLCPQMPRYVYSVRHVLRLIEAQATMNHEKIAEDVTDGLKQLSDDLVFWNKQLIVYGDSPVMQGLGKQISLSGVDVLYLC